MAGLLCLHDWHSLLHLTHEYSEGRDMYFLYNGISYQAKVIQNWILDLWIVCYEYSDSIDISFVVDVIAFSVVANQKRMEMLAVCEELIPIWVHDQTHLSKVESWPMCLEYRYLWIQHMVLLSCIAPTDKWLVCLEHWYLSIKFMVFVIIALVDTARWTYAQRKEACTWYVMRCFHWVLNVQFCYTNKSSKQGCPGKRPRSPRAWGQGFHHLMIQYG